MALVQTSGKIRTSGSGDVNVTMPSNFTAGNTALASGCRYEGLPTGLTINGTASTLDSSTSSALSGVWIRRVSNLTGGSNAAVLDTPGGSDYNTFSIEERDDIDLTSPLDEIGSTSGSGTSVSISTAGATDTANEVVYGAFNVEHASSTLGVTATGSATASWTENDSNTYQGGGGAYRVESTTGTKSMTWTKSVSGNWRGCVASYRIASGGGTAYTLTADSGTFALTGTAASLLVGRKLTADAGSYALTGQAANTLFGRKLTAEAASFVLTGTDAALKAGRLLSAEAGAFALTGADATLVYEQAGSYTLAADSGSFALSGGDVGLLAARVLAAEAGSIALTGSGAALLFWRRLQADAGSFSLTGQDATLTYEPVSGAYTLTAEPGAFTLTGADATLAYSGEQRERFAGFEIVDRPTGLWWLDRKRVEKVAEEAKEEPRKAREAAKEIVVEIAKQHAEDPAPKPERMRDVRQAIKPLLKPLGNWNWTALYAKVYEQALTEQIREELKRRDQMDEEDLEILLMGI